MSKLNKRIRAYSNSLADNENIDVEDFLSHPDNKTAVQDWLHGYKSPDTAETAFKRKFSGVNKKMARKHQKTLTGSADWEMLLEDAKTRQLFLLNSSRVFQSSAVAIANDLINNFDINAATLIEERLEESEEIDQDYPIGNPPTNHYILKSGFDITPLWHDYKLLSIDKAKKQGLSIVSDLQKALSLSHIMLLVSESNDKDMLALYGESILDSIYRNIRGIYIDKTINFDSNLTNAVKKIIVDLEDESITRIDAVVVLANLIKNSENEDLPILQALMNCIMKLPKKENSSSIGEMELITNYLDPILSPMFHQPDNHKLFRWLNKKNKESEKVDLKARPDGGMTLTEQLNDVFALGFCEIKSIDALNRHNLTHMDTFRLAMFCKNAIDDGEIKCTLAVQSVGTYVTFFLCTLESEAFYPFIQIARIKIPTSLYHLSDFVAHLDTCKRIIHTYNKFCVPIQDNDKSSLRRSSINQQQIDDSITEHIASPSPSILYT